MLLFSGDRVDGIAEFRSKDIALTHTTAQRNILIQKMKDEEVKYREDILQMPVKGKLSLKSGYSTRTDSIGLWKFTFL